MLLVRNKLKRLKKTIDDDDEYLNYLKYSHLDIFKKPRIDKEDDTEKNETHNFQLANIETKKIHTANKGVDTGDDLYKVIPPYVSLMYSEDFDRNEKMVQVWTRMLNENLPPSPPSSSSSSSSSNKGSNKSFTTKNIGRGFRLAEFALNTAITGANVAEFLWNVTSPPEYDVNAEIDEEPEQPSSSTNNSSHRDRSRSRDESEDLGDRLLRRGASRSRSNTPSSGTASSAKTTPRKKSK